MQQITAPKQRFHKQKWFLESTWVTWTWNLITTFVSKLGEMILTVSILYTSASLVPGMPKFYLWADVTMTLSQQLVLDISALVLVKEWLKLRKTGHASQARYALITFVGLITIMLASLILSIVSGHDKNFDQNLLWELEVTLLVARAIAALLYGVMLRLIVSNEDEISAPQVVDVDRIDAVAKSVQEVKENMDLITHEVQRLLSAPHAEIPQINIENHVSSALNPFADSLNAVRNENAELRRMFEEIIIRISQNPHADSAPHFAIEEVPHAESAPYEIPHSAPHEIPHAEDNNAESAPHEEIRTAPHAESAPHRMRNPHRIVDVNPHAELQCIVPELPPNTSKTGLILAFLEANNGVYFKEMIHAKARELGINGIKASTEVDARKLYANKHGITRDQITIVTTTTMTTVTQERAE